mgnify:CR=1 FL=1|tara:strand:+ start:127671 stop:128564 length:894 start_codon:yes stop_codon:yes gene_type:complete
MTTNNSDTKQLDSILAGQKLKEGSSERKALRQHRDDVQALLRAAFGSKLVIKYGGSKAKNTMIRASYDLDILCYFEHDDTAAGKTLKEIYDAVYDVLKPKYRVHKKNSALRLKAPSDGSDFHIDVVPGRFVDESKGDAYLHQNDDEKQYLKTNPQTHIDHVVKSGHSDVISILKLLSCTYDLSVKTFVLELATLRVLEGTKSKGLTERVEAVLSEFRDNIDAISVTDPANGNNDLSKLWTPTVRMELCSRAKLALEAAEKHGWLHVFPSTPSAPAVERIKRATRATKGATRPWLKKA